MFATCVATGLSVLLQHTLAIHMRPFLDPSLHLRFVDAGSAMNWNHANSFPSDTAALFFGLATVVFLEHRMAGRIAFLWSLVTVGIVRVALGWHYPSDIAGGLILGVSCVYLFTRIRFLERFCARMLQSCGPRFYLVHALLFIFLADAYSLFPGLQGFISGLSAVRAHLRLL